MNVHRKTVLVTDDQLHMQLLVKHALRDLNCRVDTASSGEEAVAKATSAPIDLLVVDLDMGELDGFETVRALKQDARYATLPVIMLTGRGQSDLRSEAGRSGVSIFMTKPFSPTELQQSAKKLLGL